MATSHRNSRAAAPGRGHTSPLSLKARASCAPDHEAQLFGPLRQLATGFMGQQIQVRSLQIVQVAQGRAELLPPLLEQGLDRRQERPVLGRRARLARATADHCRGHLGPGPEHLRRDGPEHGHLEQGTDHHRQHPVIAAPGPGDQAFGHFLLHHQHGSGRLRLAFGQREEHLAGQHVGQVPCHDRPRPRTGEDLGPVQPREIGLQQGEPGSRSPNSAPSSRQRCRSTSTQVTRSQRSSRGPVRAPPPAPSSRTRLPSAAASCGDGAGQVAVEQEILSPPLDRPDAVASQQGELALDHGRARPSAIRRVGQQQASRRADRARASAHWRSSAEIAGH
jgi:hypothetical protein